MIGRIAGNRLRWLLSVLLVVTLGTAGLPTVAAQPAAGSKPSGLAGAREQGTEIRLKYASFDPAKGGPAVPGSLAAGPGPEARHYLVQLDGPVQEALKEQISARGGRVLDYVPDFAFVVKMDGPTKAEVEGLEFVRWVGPFHPAYKIAPGLQGRSGDVTVRVRVFEGEDLGGPQGMLSASGAQVESAGGRVITARTRASDLPSLAQNEAVAWIEEYRPPELMNNKSRAKSNTAVAWTDLGLYGEGQIVAVADTGLDSGNLSTVDLDFQGRIEAYHALGRPGLWNDPHGHGTHVAGSVLGDGRSSGSDPATHSYGNSLAGMAPEAHLVMQSVLDSGGGLGGIPADLNVLFQQAYDDGARLHSNSWGESYSYGEYTVDSSNVDEFIWNNPGMTILFAAGNSGVDWNWDGVVDLGSILSPSTAKNCIAVGASEGSRPPDVGWGGYSNLKWGQLWPSSFPANPIKLDYPSNNINGMAAFSSRGPVSDGRIKPDIVAPGTNIVSVHSSATSSWGWGKYTQNPNYEYMGGTSMATPLMAGAAALVREYYVDWAGESSPSAALIKATLLNGAKDMYPGQYGTGGTREMSVAPNNVEGWGRLDLRGSLLPAWPAYPFYDDYTGGLTTGGVVTYTLPVVDGSVPLNVTLVWSDYPATGYAAYDLINDLDLRIKAPNGSIIWGNGVANGDWINNVEGVRIAGPATGTYEVGVRAYNVPNGPQPFALAASGGLDPGVAKPADSAPTGSLAINGGALATQSTAATLGVSYDGNARTMRFSNDGASWTAWQNVKLTRPWTLPGGDGVKNVFVQFKSLLNTPSDPVTGTITLDTTPPTGSVVMNGGAASIDIITPTITLSASDSSGLPVKRYRLGQIVNGTLVWQRPWTAFPVTGTLVVEDFPLRSGPDGLRTVVARFEDQAGNLSAKFKDSITLTTAPTLLLPEAKAVLTNTTPLLQWDPVPGAVKYKVIVRNPANGVVTVLGPVASEELQVSSGVLKPNKKYQWKVKAYVYGRWSGPSEQRVFTTGPAT